MSWNTDGLTASDLESVPEPTEREMSPDSIADVAAVLDTIATRRARTATPATMAESQRSPSDQ